MTIDSSKLRRLIGQHVKFQLIDVRAPQEFDQGHIEGAVNIPGELFLKKLPAAITQKDAAIVIYDDHEESSSKLVTLAEKLGYINIVDLEGGYREFLKGS